MDSQKPINLIFFQKNEKTLEKQMSYSMLFANWNNVYDSSMFNNWLSNNSEENKQLCAYPFSSPSDLENGADDIMNQAHAFVAVFEQDSGRSTNTRVSFSCFRVAAFRKWLWIGRSQEKTIK